MSQLWRQARHIIFRRVLHTDDTPHQIALGASIAIFIGILPVMGLQMISSMAICALFRANKAICIPGVWVTNPVTAVPIYGSCWWIGSALLNSAGENPISQFKPHPEYSGWGVFTHVFSADFWSWLFSVLASFGVELWLGCFILGIPCAVIGYFLTYRGVVIYRRRRRERIHRRIEQRTARLRAKHQARISA